MPITGNKGEWSELYAFLKVLGDKKLYSGNENLERIAEIAYPVLSILRTEAGINKSYTLNGDVVIASADNAELSRIGINEFTHQAQQLLAVIKNNSGSFPSPDTEQFMLTIGCSSIKAKSTDKSDIKIIVHDQRTGQNPNLGFSIKSQLGSASTLLNAGKTTNFVFQLLPTLNQADAEDINHIENPRSKIRDRIDALIQNGYRLQFDKAANPVFHNNLIFVDTSLPHIIARMVELFYSTDMSSVAEIIDHIEAENPLAFNNHYGHDFYRQKVKRLLTDIALGLMPSKTWTGQYDATGGYLLIKEDGDVLCYHLYNRNEFENYLLTNTKLETASTSRHQFGEVYFEDGNSYINLNLQIRFKK